MTEPSIRLDSHSESQTAAIGAAIAGWLQPGDILLLHGDLGAGKTVLAKGIGTALGVPEVMSSPTFALVNEHQTAPGQSITRLTHLDLYRLGPEDLDSFGYGDIIDSADAVSLIEWPERAGNHLPDRYLLIEIVATGPSERQLLLLPHPIDEQWLARTADLRRCLTANGIAP